MRGSDSIGLIEDDETIRRLIKKRLEKAGYCVWDFGTAEESLKHAEKSPLSLYIVDRMLPSGLSGTDFCQILKTRHPEVPVLILSALSQASHRIEGLKIGADDYLTKPFEVEELRLRIERLLKSSRRKESNKSPFSNEGLQVDFEKMELVVNGRVHSIGLKEGKVLELLIQRKGFVVTREQILDEVWGESLFPSPRTVDNFIVRLRKLIEVDPQKPKYIQSVRGMGYKFC